MDAAAKTALFNALAWIESKKSDAGVDHENVEVGLQCLTEAFGLNLQDAGQKSAYALTGGDASFPEIFSAGLTTLGLTTKGADASWENDPAITKNPALWKKWVAKLEDKGFFNGAPVGSDEYNSRIKKALAKYKERVADAKPAAAPPLSKEEKEKLAEEAKAKGNAALGNGDYETAAKLYSSAIAHSSDGPNSHIYYANYAAALTYLGRYDEVIDNCEKSIALKPSYVKAYSRMGNAQVHLKKYDDAIDSFRRGLEVDASNAACRDGLAEAERKQRQMQTSSSSSTPAAARGAGAGGMPDLSSLAGMFGGAGGGGGGGLADLLSNPAMQQMAASMMQNPAMMQMAQNMMQNPEALSGLMGNLGGGSGGGGGGGGGGGSGGMPDMAGMANAFRNSPELMAARSDPDLQDFFRDVDQEGPSAAMRHMSNPKVSQLIQNAMAGMQG